MLSSRLKNLDRACEGHLPSRVQENQFLRDLTSSLTELLSCGENQLVSEVKEKQLAQLPSPLHLCIGISARAPSLVLVQLENYRPITPGPRVAPLQSGLGFLLNWSFFSLATPSALYTFLQT